MITKEHIEQAKRDTIQIYDDLLSNFDKYARITSAYWENGKIIVEFEANVDIDIHYWFGDKVHEVEDYVGEIEQTGRLEIGVNQYDKDWNVQVVGEEVVSEIVNVGAFQKDVDLFFGFWYSDEVPDNNPLKQICTVGQVRSINYEPMKKVVDSSLKVIPNIGTFDPNDSEHQLRSEVKNRVNVLDRIGNENVEFIILADEPNKLSVNQLEIVAYEAQKQYKVPSTFMYTRGALLDGCFAKNQTLIGNNFYPFFDKDAPDGYVQVWSYEDFKRHADEVYEKVREKDVKIVMTAQTFYKRDGVNGKPWRKPPLESAEWYLRYAQESEDIVGILFWEWQTSDRWIGLEDMPDLHQAWIDAIQNTLH